MAQACSPALAFEQPLQPLLDHRRTGLRDPSRARARRPRDGQRRHGQRHRGRPGIFRAPRAGRRAAPSMSRTTPATIRTTGWMRIYAVDKEMSLATVVHACDTIERRRLPRAVHAAAGADARATRRREAAARELRTHPPRHRSPDAASAKGDFFIVDRGSDHGVTLGARFVVYRDKRRMETLTCRRSRIFPTRHHAGVPLRSGRGGRGGREAGRPRRCRSLVSRDAFLAGDLRRASKIGRCRSSSPLRARATFTSVTRALSSRWKRR